MKIVTNWNVSQSQDEVQGVVFAFGAFDGIHLGHQLLIRELKAKATELGLKTALLAFANHPLEVLFPGRTVPKITLSTTRRKLLEELGIDYLLELPFTEKIASMEPERFVEAVLGIIPVKVWIAGEDVAFGRSKGGDREVLEILAMKTGFKVEFIKKREGYSSSAIRSHILEGNFEQAQKLLGRPYSLVCERAQGVVLGVQEEAGTIVLYLDTCASPKSGAWKVQVMGVAATVTFGITPEVCSLHFEDLKAYEKCKEASTIEIMFTNELQLKQ